MTATKVTVIGGGNGGRTAAADFALAGNDVVLYDLPEFAGHLDAIAASGVIRASGAISGDAPVRIAPDLVAAIDGADTIVICVPTMHQRAFAELLAPLLTDESHVVLMPGSFGSLAFRTRVGELRALPDMVVSEIAALPYATRITGPDQVHVFGKRRYISIGVFPAVAAERVMPTMELLYPGIELMSNVIEAGLNNPNPTLHCLGVLMSASRIEYSHGEFYYYEEGMTPHVCAAIEAIDAERLAIGAAAGVEVLSLQDTYARMGYGPSGDSFWSVIRGVAALNGIKGPAHIDSRYLTEDVPIGLTIYSQLGRQLGVPTPIMESVITLTKALLSRDFADDERTLAGCGIEGLDRENLTDFVTTGIR